MDLHPASIQHHRCSYGVQVVQLPRGPQAEGLRQMAMNRGGGNWTGVLILFLTPRPMPPTLYALSQDHDPANTQTKSTISRPIPRTPKLLPDAMGSTPNLYSASHPNSILTALSLSLRPTQSYFQLIQHQSRKPTLNPAPCHATTTKQPSVQHRNELGDWRGNGSDGWEVIDPQ